MAGLYSDGEKNIFKYLQRISIYWKLEKNRSLAESRDRKKQKKTNTFCTMGGRYRWLVGNIGYIG